MSIFFQFLIPIVLAIFTTSLPLKAMIGQEQIGFAIIHGKRGSPTRYVSDLASALEEKGYIVANIEMPWSGKRGYDVSVSAAEQELESTLSTLRRKGVQKVFVAGHSQGCAFALHFAGNHSVDGIVCMAPGGDASSPIFIENIGASVADARKLMAEGKGDEKAQFYDVDSLKGKAPIVTTPAVYLTWFEPEGAMNMPRAARAVNPQMPILWIVPKRDYHSLRKSSIPLFGTLPSNPQTKLYEPNTDHLGAPAASVDEIVRWIALVALAQGK